VRSPLFTGLDSYLPEDVLGDPRRLKYPWREDYQGERFAVKFPELAKPFIENAAPRQWTHFDGTPLRLGLCSGLANTGYSVSSSSFPDYSLPPPEEKHHYSGSAKAYESIPPETRREPSANSSLVFSYLRRRDYTPAQPSANQTRRVQTQALPSINGQSFSETSANEGVAGSKSAEKVKHLRYRPGAPGWEYTKRSKTARLSSTSTVSSTIPAVAAATSSASSTQRLTFETLSLPVGDFSGSKSMQRTIAPGAGMPSHKPRTNGVATIMRASNTKTSRIFF